MDGIVIKGDPVPRRQRWHFAQSVVREIADEDPDTLDIVEQMLRDHAEAKNAEQGLKVVSDTGIEWFESPNRDPEFDETRRFLSERAWTRGEPIEFDYLFCRLSGESIAPSGTPPTEEPAP